MKDEFNKHCAEVMGFEYQIVTPQNGSHIWIYTKDIGVYNPYDDLNAMAEVVEKLLVSPPCHGVTLSAPINIKQAFRDFIISTMESTNIQHDGEEK